MHFIPGLALRVDEESEILGIDDAEMGEFAYDYVGLEQELGHTLGDDVGAVGGAREPQHFVKSTSSSEEKHVRV
jgi:ammonium transporter, Amt family